MVPLAQTILEKHANKIKKVLDLLRYDYRHWTRPVMYSRCTDMLRQLPLKEMDVLEISAGQYWKTMDFKSFAEANFPEFDICQGVLDRKFDLIIADQVFEHLLWPYRAAKNVYSTLRPGGYFLITTPFLIKVHAIPYDCTRWTETGLRYFLAECGFELENIQTGSWGNRNCVKSNFRKWARRGWFGSLRNEPDFPVAVWALARKT